MRRTGIAVAAVVALLLVVWLATRERSTPPRNRVPPRPDAPASAEAELAADEPEARPSVPGWRIAGTVVDRDGRPVAGQVVECRAAGFGLDTTLSNDAGAFAFSQLPLRRWRVSLGDTPWAAVTAYSGDERIRLVLPDVCSVEGRVVGPSEGVLTDGCERCDIEEDGTFRLDNMEPGRRMLFAFWPGNASLRLDLKPGEHREGVELRSAEARSWIPVRIVGPAGEPIRASVTAGPQSFLPAAARTLGHPLAFPARVRSSGGLLPALPPDTRGRREARTDESGYTVVSAPEEPGTLLDVTVDAEPWPLVTIKLSTSPAAESPATTIRLPQLRPALVHVVDDRGIPATSVVGLSSSGRVMHSQSDAGEHEFRVATGQAYSVVVIGQGVGNAGVQRKTIEEWLPSKADFRLTVELQRPRLAEHAPRRVEIAGRVVDPRGQPLGGVLVTPIEDVEGERLFGFAWKEVDHDEDVREPLTDSTATDAEGRFRLAGAFEGGYLRFAKPGHGPIAVPNASARDADTVLPRGSRLRLRVTMPGAWNANHWWFDLARDGGRHGWTTLVARPRGVSRFELVPLGEGLNLCYPMVDSAAEAELADLGPGRVAVRLRTTGFSVEREVDIADAGTVTVEFSVPE